MAERALLTALGLSLTARWRRLCAETRQHPLLTIALVGAVTAACALMLTAARTPVIRTAILWAAQHEFLVGLVTALYALLFVTRKRAHLRQERSRSWLLPTPIPKRAFAMIAALRIALELVVHLQLSAVVVFALAAVNNQAPADGWNAVIALAGGILAGAAIGAIWPLRGATPRSEESRFVRKTRAATMKPSLDGLSRWPIAKAIAWHRPENARVLFIIAAMSVPMGTSALLGLAILATWTLVSYLLAVVRAVPAVAREASAWLRPVSLPFASFARSIGTRALVHQIVGTALIGCVFVLIGADIDDVVYLSCLWLASTVMIGSIALRQSYLSLPSFGRTLLAVLVVLVAESRVRGGGLPIAVVVAGFHLRGVRERA